MQMTVFVDFYGSTPKSPKSSEFKLEAHGEFDPDSRLFESGEIWVLDLHGNRVIECGNMFGELGLLDSLEAVLQRKAEKVFASMAAEADTDGDVGPAPVSERDLCRMVEAYEARFTR